MFLPAECYTVYDEEKEREKWKAKWVIDLLSAPLKSWNKGEPLSNERTTIAVKKKCCSTYS